MTRAEVRAQLVKAMLPDLENFQQELGIGPPIEATAAEREGHALLTAELASLVAAVKAWAAETTR